MCKTYIAIGWPEIQEYFDHPRYNETYIAYKALDQDSLPVYMIPEDLYNEVQESKLPKEYEFEGEIYEAFKGECRKGDLCLVELDDGSRKVLKSLTSCVHPLYGHILFEENYLPGINCEIIGIKHAE